MITTIEKETETKTETIKIHAFCDTCTNTDYATEEALKSVGWELTKNYQFCPNCAIG